MSTEAVDLPDLVTGAITWKVSVGHNGFFYAEAAQMPRVNTETYEKMELACKRHAQKVKVKVRVPYVRFGNGVAVHGYATGIHATSDRVLCREGGQAEQHSGWAHDI